MRFTELNEVGNFSDFSTHAQGAVDSLGKLAGGAYSKLKGSYDKSKSKIEGEHEKALSAAEKEAEKEAEKAAEKTKQDADNAKQDSARKSKRLGQQIPQLVAKVVLDRTPDSPDMIEEFHALDAEQFNSVYGAIDKAKERMSKFPREMRKVLKASDFLQAQHRTDSVLNEMLGEQPDKSIEPAEDMLMKNLYDEQGVWEKALATDDIAGAAQDMVELIKAISRDFEKRNLAATGSGKPKNYPEEIGVVRLISSQRQLIAMRLDLLRGAIEQLSSKPVTEAALRRVRKLLERML